MAGSGKLTELLTSRPVNMKAVVRYGRSQQLEIDCLQHLAMSEDNMTLIHIAGRRGTHKIMEALLNEGWNVDFLDGSALTPLWASLECGNIPVAHLLIHRGADVKFTSKDKRTMMGPALVPNKGQTPCINCIKLLLEAGLSVNDSVDGITLEKPIHIATYNKHCKVLKFLIQNGADVNAENSRGMSALHVAVQYNSIKALKILMRHEINLYKENNYGDSALQMALKLNFIKTVEILVKGGCNINHVFATDGSYPIYMAICTKNLELVKKLVELGADVNKPLSHDTRSSPLYSLASRNIFIEWSEDKKSSPARKSIAEFLIEKGARLNDPDKLSPLVMAIRSGFLGLACLFVSSGANINVKYDNFVNDISLFHVVVGNNHRIITHFLEYGADFNAINNVNMTPYHFAIMNGVDMKYIRHFVKYGCPYNQKPEMVNGFAKKEGSKFYECQTQFFKGIKANDLEMVRAAVENGAVINGCSEEIRYPVHYLAYHGFNDLLNYLLGHGVPPNKLNNRGESALCIAIDRGHYDCCCTLFKFGACYNYKWKVDRKSGTTKVPKQDSQTGVSGRCVSRLLHNVHRMFSLARTGNMAVLKKLEKMLAHDVNEYFMYANVSNSKGDSLLGIAIRNNHTNIVHGMMRLRTKV